MFLGLAAVVLLAGMTGATAATDTDTVQQTPVEDNRLTELSVVPMNDDCVTLTSGLSTQCGGGNPCIGNPGPNCDWS
jgi:hypothetical protein